MKRFASLFALAAAAGSLMGAAPVIQAQTEMYLSPNPSKSDPAHGVYCVDVYATFPVRAPAFAVSAALVYDPNVFYSPNPNGVNPPKGGGGITTSSFFNLVANPGEDHNFMSGGKTYTLVVAQMGKSGTTNAIAGQQSAEFCFQTISGGPIAYPATDILLSGAYFGPDTNLNASLRSSVGYKGYQGYTALQPTTFHTDSTDPLFASRPAKVTVGGDCLPVPNSAVVCSISPAIAQAGGSDFMLTVTGSGFDSSTTVLWNNTPRTTIYVSPIQLTAAIPASDIANIGTASVTVTGAVSSALTFTINGSPVISSLSPNSAPAHSAALTLTVNGTYLSPDSMVQWNGNSLTTNYVSPTQLIATVPASYLLTPGVANVNVHSQISGTTNALTFTINALPTLSSLSPSLVAIGGPAFTLTVNGGNFSAGSIVQVNGSARPTTFVSGTQLTAAIPASDITSIGSENVTVNTPTVGTSNSLPLTVDQLPSLLSLSPSQTTAGSAVFTLTVNGSNFNPNTSVQWNGSARPTIFVSSTQLTAVIPASDVNTAGTASVTVNNALGTSNALTFTINSGAPIISSLSPDVALAGSPAFTLTVNGSNFTADAVVQWNGSSLSTSYVSSTTLTTVVPASYVTTPGSASVTVYSPTAGTTNSLTFTIGPAISTQTEMYLALNTAKSNSSQGIYCIDVYAAFPVNGSAFAVSAALVYDPSVFYSPHSGTGGSAITANSFFNLIPNPGADHIFFSGGRMYTLVVEQGGRSGNSIAVSDLQSYEFCFQTISGGPVATPATDILLSGAYFGADTNQNADLRSSVAYKGYAGYTTTQPTLFHTADTDPLFASRPAKLTLGNDCPPSSSGSVVCSISPASARAGGSDFMLTVKGNGFDNSTTVLWNNTPRTTVYVSPMQVTAVIPASDIAHVGTASVTVTGAASSALTFTINGIPILNSLVPNQVRAGGSPFTLTLNGSYFGTNSVVLWNGAARPTTFVSGTQLTAAIPASDIAVQGTATLTVNNPGADGGTSNPQTLLINALPVLSSLSPSPVSAGGADFMLTVKGNNFSAGSVVQVNGSARTTTFVSSTQLTAAIPASDIASAGTASITVYNAAVGTSNTLLLTVITPVVIASLDPSAVEAGSAGFFLTVTGSGFQDGAVVSWNGSPRTTAVLSSTQVIAAIPASDIAAPGTINISVTNPSGAQSGSLPFKITFAQPRLVSLAPDSAVTGTGSFLLTINGSGFQTGATVLWNSAERTTLYLSSTQVGAIIPAADIAASGAASITVRNPSGTLSNALAFAIGKPRLTTKVVLARDTSTNEIVATITLSNIGTADAVNTQITQSTLAISATSTALPLSVGTIPIGGSQTATLRFPAAAGAAGSSTSFTLAGAYTGGTLGSSLRVRLP